MDAGELDLWKELTSKLAWAVSSSLLGGRTGLSRAEKQQLDGWARGTATKLSLRWSARTINPGISTPPLTIDSSPNHTVQVVGRGGRETKMNAVLPSAPAPPCRCRGLKVCTEECVESRVAASAHA